MSPTQSSSRWTSDDCPLATIEFDEKADLTSVQNLVASLNTKGSKKSAIAEALTSIVVDNSKSRLNFQPLKAWNLASSLKTLVEDSGKSAAEGREGALVVLLSLATSECSAARAFECLMLSLLVTIMDLLSDKVKAVQVAADSVLNSFVKILSPLSVRTLIIPSLLESMGMKKAWQTKVAALNILSGICDNLPLEVASQLPSIVPVLSETVHDVKEQVKKAAYDTMIKACMCVGNRDIEPFVPAIVGCVARPEEVSECVHQLGSTTFVSQVQTPTLAIIVPLLRRGLREGATAIKRKAALIIDNMSKLVEPPTEAEIFLPVLLPELKKCSEEVSDQDCRNVCGRAMTGLRNIEAAIVREAQHDTKRGLKDLTKTIIIDLFKQATGKYKAVVELPENSHVLNLVAAASLALCARDDFKEESWLSNLGPYVFGGIGLGQIGQGSGSKGVKEIVAAYRGACEAKLRALGGFDTVALNSYEDDTVGEVLCDCQFTLAYGAKILLNQTRLKLYRGMKYALCGPIGIGKSTLMRSIASGQLEGFPTSDEVRTVFVKHDIEPELLDYPTVDYVMEDKLIKSQGITREEVVAKLREFGFTEAMINNAVFTLSGGWKMKLALARATLVDADILLLDEPTNHLDVANQAWITEFVQRQEKATIIVICHDPPFVNKCCTHIVHFENRKLKIFHGNLEAFIQKCPEVKVYYEPRTDDEFFKHKMSFPEPGYLEGVKVKDKAILKCYSVAFTYPNTTRQVINGISIFVSLASRVAVIGPNGAGKSTLIKVLTGELEPSSGTVWKHPNLRVAYVAQHAFHHIEHHLTKTPVEYIMWRYATGEDREAAQRADRKVDEKKEEFKTLKINGQNMVVEKILARRKDKKLYEYEVQWKGKQPIPDETTWLPRDKLEDMGYSKMLAEVDAREAAAAGMWCKPLTSDEICKHLDEVGLDRELALHTQLNSMSGGQKVKVVLGACTWNNPHVIILDEPTNYLDSTSLAGLAEAIKTFNGGILLISHHRDFLDALCTEQWAMKDGLLTQIGGVELSEEDRKVMGAGALDEMIDGAGNVVKIKQQKKELSRKEQKAKERYKKIARDNGEVVDSDDDAWYDKLKAAGC